MKNKSFVLNLERHDQSVHRSKFEIDSQLWHRRLGHSNEIALKYTSTLDWNMPQVGEIEGSLQCMSVWEAKRAPISI